VENNEIKIATLFSGIGAPEQAASRVFSEHKIIFACELDEFARESYLANYNINAEDFHKDVHDLNGIKYRGKIDILIGGSPCQSFSMVGLRNGTDDKRGQLIYQYIRIVEECMPKIIIYENVKGMMSIDSGKTFKEFVQALRDIGYYCHHDTLNTKDYNIPQNRERIFLIGFLDLNTYHRFEFAPKQILTKRLNDILESNVQEKYYLDRELDDIYNYTPTESLILDDYNSNIKKDGIACSLTTNCGAKAKRNGMKVIEPPRTIRRLTPRECLRLQDFSDSFKIIVSDRQAYKQAGNSMSVNILSMIFNQIKVAQSSEKTNSLMDFI